MNWNLRSSRSSSVPAVFAASAASAASDLLNKVPAVTAGFWIIKILSTTVGETGADYLAVNAGMGQFGSAGLMTVLLAIAAFLQVRARRRIVWLYWLTVILISIVGTQITDGLTDGLGISLYLSSAAFGVTLAVVFWIWYRCERTLSIRAVNTRRRELFYWACVLCTFALGTAAGDLATEVWGLGFRLGVLAFGASIGATLLAWCFGASAVLTFWLAYILTRPLGAALGDLLTQATEYGGLGIGAKLTSAIFLAAIVALVALSQYLGARPKAASTN